MRAATLPRYASGLSYLFCKQGDGDTWDAYVGQLKKCANCARKKVNVVEAAVGRRRKRKTTMWMLIVDFLCRFCG